MAAETGAARYRTGAYAFWHAHVRVLLRAAGVADPADTLTDLPLAPLAGEVYRQLRDRGVGKGQIHAALDTLARRVLG